MSQLQPDRPRPNEAQGQPITYGDVFPVAGELARQAIAPQDAAMMQSAENRVLGQSQKGSPAAKMQAAAAHNEQAGFVGHDDASSVPAALGVTVAETDLPGVHVVTEYVAGQVVGQQRIPAPVGAGVVEALDSNITIGEALEASALTAGDKPIDRSDAAAIQAAEARATGLNATIPGGIASAAQSAADANARIARDEDKTRLADVLSDAAARLPADKAATRDDAEKVMGAELRNNPGVVTHPGGVAASIVAAARLNEGRQA